MKPEVKQKWVEALRSGAYTQVAGYLRRNDSYCCLGVLCDLAIKDGVNLPVEPAKLDAGETIAYAYGGSRQWLPTAVMDWAGLNDSDPTPQGEDTGGDTLSELNDSGDYDFPAIAEIIEKQL